MSIRFLLLFLALSGLTALARPVAARHGAGGAGASGKVFPHAVAESVLDNGLRVVVVPMDSPGLMSHYLVVRAGSRNEVEPGLSGFAHFFEHMMFRGTERYPADRYNEVLRRLGADSNAFTTDDWTCYHTTAAAGALEQVMEIEADRFMNLEYTVEAFQKEAGAVLGEYNKNYSVPMMSLFEKLHDAAYDKHTYKHTTMGFLKDIEDMPNQYDYSRTFFQRWSRPDNCVLVVAGDVAPQRVFELARKYYGPWKRGAATLETPDEPPQTRERVVRVPWKNPTLPYLVIGYHVPAFSPDDVEGRALDVLAEAAFSESSPLYKDLVLEKQWVEVLRGGQEDRRDPTLFVILTRVKDEARIGAVRDAIFAALDDLGRRPLPVERIAAVKSSIRYSFLQSLDTPDRVALTVGSFMELTGDVSSIERTQRTFEEVTAEDVMRVAAKFFGPANRTVVTLSHEKEPRP